MQRFGAIERLISCISNVADSPDDVSDICDETLILAVATLGKTNASDDCVEELIKLIKSKAAKVSGFYFLV